MIGDTIQPERLLGFAAATAARDQRAGTVCTDDDLRRALLGYSRCVAVVTNGFPHVPQSLLTEATAHYQSERFPIVRSKKAAALCSA